MSLFPVLQHTCARCASHTQHEVGLGREVGLGLSTLALDSIQGPSALHFSDPSVSLENRRWEPMWAGTHMDVEWSENPLVEVGGGFGSCRPHSSACPLSLPSVFQQHLRIAVLLLPAGSGSGRVAKPMLELLSSLSGFAALGDRAKEFEAMLGHAGPAKQPRNIQTTSHSSTLTSFSNPSIRCFSCFSASKASALKKKKGPITGPSATKGNTNGLQNQLAIVRTDLMEFIYRI